jgi:hypothetical protein
MPQEVTIHAVRTMRQVQERYATGETATLDSPPLYVVRSQPTFCIVSQRLV